jgi:hypothetical protein
MPNTPGATTENRFVILVQPNGKFLVSACPLPGSMPPEQVAKIESIVPASVKRNIIAIANTPLVTGQEKPMAVADDRTSRAVGEAIPFLGILIGMAYIGHAVRVFNGRTPPLASGCKDADLLIVDSAMCTHLGDAWETTALKALRTPNILIHDRATFSLRVVHPTTPP